MDNAFRQAAARDHVALFYRDQREEFSATVPFIRTGIERGEQCLYIAGEEGPDAARDALRTDGIDLDALERAGALLFRSQDEVYLPTGRFDKDRMMSLWTEAAKQAIDAGHTGLRATGDLTWSTEDPPGAKNVMAYERELENQFRRLPVMALCRYNRARFDQDILDEATRMHARVIADGVLKESSLYVPPRDGLNWSTEAFAALLTPYIDSELPESMTAHVAERIRKDASLRHLYEAELAVKRTLRAYSGRYTAPVELAGRIRAAVFGQPHAK
ncbi:MAG: MEDS domain-containing protein [Verrucomicrobia bacterium]|nr:MEDS domain-containing protein [Verrucomicrobiota bacterium]